MTALLRVTQVFSCFASILSRKQMQTTLKRVWVRTTQMTWSKSSKKWCISSSLHSLYLQVPCPDVYRGKYRETDYPEECLGKKYADDVKQVIKKVRDNGRTVSAFITESLQSCGGQIIPPPNYLRNVIRWGKPNTINIKLISLYSIIVSGVAYCTG